MDFSRQGYWSELPYPSPRNLPNPDPGIGSVFSALETIDRQILYHWASGEAIYMWFCNSSLRYVSKRNKSSIESVYINIHQSFNWNSPKLKITQMFVNRWMDKWIHIFYIFIKIVTHVLAIINSAVMNIGVHMSLSDLVSLVCMPRSGIAGSYGSFVSRF